MTNTAFSLVEPTIRIKSPIPINFKFTDEERDELYLLLNSVPGSPFSDYSEYNRQIQSVLSSGRVPARFLDECERARTRNQVIEPFHHLKNCPIDNFLPELDWEDSVNEKYRKKLTFVAEGFLLLYAAIMKMPPIAYKNVNSGDYIHDIHPVKSLKDSQSQKTTVTLGFHNDLANHFVNPDYVNLLSLRSNYENKIYTTFVRCLDLLCYLDRNTIHTLKQPCFYTPYDDLTMYGDKAGEIGEARDHAVINDDITFLYFENRTIGRSPDAKRAIIELNRALHTLKASVLMQPRDFVGVCNNTSIHGKDVCEVPYPEDVKRRWSIKTVNVDRLSDHEEYFIPGSYGVVNG